MRQRREAVAAVAPPAEDIAAALGLDAPLTVRYRPRSRAADSDQLAAELRERISHDLERGFSGHGPHRDEFSLLLGDREVRVYGSQGQQRLSLLSLLLAEREALAERREAAPVMLLDDVMSELDHTRRQALIDLLRSRVGQAILTTTELEQIPGAGDPGVARLTVAGGTVLEEVAA
jgi:DNA replication and repair protein RecF